MFAELHYQLYKALNKKIKTHALSIMRLSQKQPHFILIISTKLKFNIAETIKQNE